MYVSPQDPFGRPLNKITSKTQIHSYQDLFAGQDEIIIQCYVNYVNTQLEKNLRHEEFCVSPSASQELKTSLNNIIIFS